MTLTAEREGKTVVMDGLWKFRDGDQVAIAIHAPEREDALRELAVLGFTKDRRTSRPTSAKA